MKVKWNKKNCFSHHMTWCDLFSMEFYFDIKWSKDFKWDFEAVFSKFCNDLRLTSFISLKIQKFWSKFACKASNFEKFIWKLENFDSLGSSKIFWLRKVLKKSMQCFVLQRHVILWGAPESFWSSIESVGCKDP